TPYAGHQILFVGADRLANNGDSGIGFMFLQEGLNKVCGGAALGSCTGGTFDDGNGGPVHHSAGDIYIVSAFTQGGEQTGISVFTWDPTLNGGKGDWGNELPGADCRAVASPDFACATVFGDGV